MFVEGFRHRTADNRLTSRTWSHPMTTNRLSRKQSREIFLFPFCSFDDSIWKTNVIVTTLFEHFGSNVIRCADCRISLNKINERQSLNSHFSHKDKFTNQRSTISFPSFSSTLRVDRSRCLTNNMKLIVRIEWKQDWIVGLPTEILWFHISSVSIEFSSMRFFQSSAETEIRQFDVTLKRREKERELKIWKIEWTDRFTRLSSRRLSGLISRWMNPRRWIDSMAWAVSAT